MGLVVDPFERLEELHGRFPPPKPFHILEPALHQFLSVRFVLNQPLHPLGDGCRVQRIDQQGGVPGDFGEGAGGGGEYGRSTRLRLQHGKAKPFV